MSKVVDYFLKYVAFDTQSAEDAGTVPSTEKQFALAKLLSEQLKNIGVKDVSMSEHGYVYGTIPLRVFSVRSHTLTVSLSATVLHIPARYRSLKDLRAAPAQRSSVPCFRQCSPLRKENTAPWRSRSSAQTDTRRQDPPPQSPHSLRSFFRSLGHLPRS